MELEPEALPEIPGYAILRELGRGGMGVVYLARQEGLNREVALKVILAGVHADAGTRQRFRSEAETLARLRHPSIVQIFEIGEHQGNPFFSLEYLDGGSLDAALRGTPLPAAVAAAWVAALADAMQAAHDSGVLHRDLKPANILLAVSDQQSALSQTHPMERLTAESSMLNATPKITDFGLAKILGEESGKTRTGAVLGTPSYMAPEQAEGKKALGPAVDIYALGAILYECLTGRPPFRATTPLDTIMQVVAEDPVPPRRLQSQVPRDLETICLKCLHKDPQKRYLQASGLAVDLRRFLRNEPIAARAASAWERCWRWCQRRPAVAGLLAGLVLLFLIAFAVVTWLWQEARLQRGNAQTERDQAKAQFARAEANFLLARQAVEDSLNHLNDDVLEDHPGLSEVRKKLLTSALRFYEEFNKQAAADPGLQYDRALAFHRMASITSDIESDVKAIPLMNRAIAIMEKLHEQFPTEPTYQHVLAKHLTNQAGHYYNADEYGACDQAATRAIALFLALPKDYRARPDVGRDHMTLYSMRGRLLQSLTRYAEAEKMVLEFVRLAEGRAEANASDPDARFELVSAYDQLAGLYLFMNKVEHCRDLQRKQKDILEVLVRDYPQRLSFTRALGGKLVNQAVFHRRFGEVDDALKLYHQACKVLAGVLAKEPNDTMTKRFLRNANMGMARAYNQLGRYAEALPCWDKAIELEAGPFRDCLRLHRASNLAMLGRHAEANEVWQAIPRRFKNMPDELVGLAETLASARVITLQSSLSLHLKSPLSERYAHWIEQLLQQAAQEGFKDQERLREHLKRCQLMDRPGIIRALHAMQPP